MSAVIHYAPRKTEPKRLGQEIAELCSYIHAATCHLLELIREFDEGRHWEEQGFRSCVEWLGFHCGLGPGAAREHLRVAQALPGLPKIGEAFADGRLSYSKVRAMTRVATPVNEGFLMMVAKHGAASHVERLVSQYRRVQKLEHPDKAGELYLARETTYHFDDDGCLMMKVRVPADRDELAVKALEMAMEAAYDPDDESPVAARRRSRTARMFPRKHCNESRAIVV